MYIYTVVMPNSSVLKYIYMWGIENCSFGSGSGSGFKD